MKGRSCRVDIASARQEEQGNRIAAGNWREGHTIVERPNQYSRPGEVGVRMERSSGKVATFSAPQGNWRDTAKPVESAPSPVHSSFVRDTTKPSTPPVIPTRKPDLKLLPRTAPIEPEEGKLATEDYKKSSKPNPFGAAKPREIVIAEKQSFNEAVEE